MKNEALDLVNFEQAKRLKAAGFDWWCTHFYDFDSKMAKEFRCRNSSNNYQPAAPSVALALKWFIDAKGINNYVVCSIYHRWSGNFYWKRECVQTDCLRSREAAESALLDELLELTIHH